MYILSYVLKYNTYFSNYSITSNFIIGDYPGLSEKQIQEGEKRLNWCHMKLFSRQRPNLVLLVVAERGKERTMMLNSPRRVDKM